MAGVDKEFAEGEAVPMAGLNIGYLPQEPQLDPDQTVRESVEAGMGDVFTAKARLEEIYAAYGEEDADFDALVEEQAKMEAIIGSGRYRFRTPVRDCRLTRCAFLRGMPKLACCRVARSAVWPCAACCFLNQTCCCSMSQPITWMRSR